MIYKLLLIQKRGIFIPSDIFARRDYGRTGSTPYECLYCGLGFLSEQGCRQHISKYHGRVCSHCRFPAHLRLPRVSVSLLRTCHIIRLETSPILYSKNVFHFFDAATASNFRWSTDCARASTMQEIGIKFGSEHYKSVTRWVTYFTKHTLGFGQDFPHLRRMTINLGVWVGLESEHLLRSMSQGFKESSQGLDWVLVLKLNDERVLDCFEPLVDREGDSNNGKKGVQRYVWSEEKGGSAWKDVLLWWGSPGEVASQKHKSVFNQRQPKTRTNKVVEQEVVP